MNTQINQQVVNKTTEISQKQDFSDKKLTDKPNENDVKLFNDKLQHAKNPEAKGDQVLQNVFNTVKKLEEQNVKIEDSMNNLMSKKIDISPQELLEVQLQFARFGITSELCTKSTDKVSQGFQTLFKNQ